MILETIVTRRSIRKYRDRDIEEDKIEKIVEAALWAPSAGNMQPWVFIVVGERKNRENLKAVSPGMFDLPGVIVAICRDMEIARRTGNELLSLMDVSMATQNILLETHELGLGACPIKSFNQKAVQKLLDLPESIIPELLVSIGYPDEAPSPPKRREETVYFERYGGRHG